MIFFHLFIDSFNVGRFIMNALTSIKYFFILWAIKTTQKLQ